MSDFEEFYDQLGVRAKKALMFLQINSFDLLEACSADDILRCPNIGRKGLRELEDGMNAYGKVLADRPRIQSAESLALRHRQKNVAAKLDAIARELVDLARYLRQDN